MKNLSLCCILLTLSLAASGHAARTKAAPKWKGTVAVKGKHSEAELAQMAKVSETDAEKTALAAVKAKNKKVADHELEVENGFLIYSFDVKVAGKPGIEEILVDAGSGKVLAHQHESDAAEKKEDAAKEKQEDAAAEKKEKGGK
jgi:uncharacterized membrane protein YkoI